MNIKSPKRETSEPPNFRKSLDENPYRESVASTKAAVWTTDGRIKSHESARQFRIIQKVVAFLPGKGLICDC